ncbi:hypothetical protein COY14_01700 [Candidatus Roizmanbacteria bacterium CG_4_10_14_0_2_um_filter_36_9]|uniref:THIF-type NAD/FAD binding fold domain-containing protein n=1 Tax=Candidatus Roizmanbacteria bacterium CG_4_10_14_0_2_um_filter_36_9 TaxID=1974823 RepID=A0A2M7U4T3_9BACT|nr:MAG: hypothetical protein COY14_01700 [Candidatus Roizmanbacteria bacterium CG_4_10_14_0_2_um_filter_36_9]
MGKMKKPQIFQKIDDVPKGVKLIDAFKSSLYELFIVKNPKYKEKNNVVEYQNFYKAVKFKPVWIYFPWRDVVVKSLPEKEYNILRTARNKNIITKNEQQRYRQGCIGIIGMSIGSAMLSSIVSTGGPKNIKIADDDIIEVSNLNRMRATFLDVGLPKTRVAAQKSWEVDPFLNIDLFKTINKENLRAFLENNQKLDAVIDAMDSLSMKVTLRRVCRELKIPVLMATSNGDNSIIDIERYDIDENGKIFSGRIEEDELVNMKTFTQKEWVAKAVKIVDKSILVDRLLESIPKIGKTLSGVPQLATTVNMSGAAISFVIRKILTGDKIISGRYIIGLDSTFYSQ